MCTGFVTFILSFFNATVFQRWWRLRELCGKVAGTTVDTTIILSSHVKKREDMEELLRLLWLAHALHVHSVDPRATMDAVLEILTQEGLLLPEECSALLHTTLASSTPLSITYGWFSSRFAMALQDVEASLKSGLLQTIQNNVSTMRSAGSDIHMYLSTPVPEAYTQLLELMVTTYVLMAPLGLVPRLLWMAVPGCFIVTLVFYGFMSLGKLMLNPFGGSSKENFDTSAYLSSTRSTCRLMVDSVFLPRIRPSSLEPSKLGIMGSLIDKLDGKAKSGGDRGGGRGRGGEGPLFAAMGGKGGLKYNSADDASLDGGNHIRRRTGAAGSTSASPFLGPATTTTTTPLDPQGINPGKRAASPSVFYGLER